MLPFRIGLRFLLDSKLQTVLIAVGIGIGVSVQVFIGSLIQGLQDDLIDSTIGNSSQVTIRAEERGELMDDDPGRLEALKDFDPDITAFNRVLEDSAFLKYEEAEEQIVIRGFDYEEAAGIYDFEERLVDGRLPKEPNETVLGVELFDNTGLSLGDEAGFLQPPQESDDFEVVGTVDMGVADLNETWALTTLEGAKAFLDTEGISAYEMQLRDVFRSDELASELAVAYPDLRISEWQSANEDLLSGLEGQSISSAMIQLFVIISVVLGISSVLAITVLQKSRQLGILKAMGITDRRASAIFLAQGLLLGVIGAILGVSIGIGLLVVFEQLATDQAGDPIVPIALDPLFVTFSAMVAIVASLIASVIPARRSSRLSVIEVIRNG